MGLASALAAQAAAQQQGGASYPPAQQAYPMQQAQQMYTPAAQQYTPADTMTPAAAAPNSLSPAGMQSVILARLQQISQSNGLGAFYLQHSLEALATKISTQVDFRQLADRCGT